MLKLIKIISSQFSIRITFAQFCISFTFLELYNRVCLPVLGASCHQNSVAMRMKLTFAKSTIIGNFILLGSIWYCSDVIVLSGHIFLTSSGTCPHLKRIMLKRRVSWSTKLRSCCSPADQAALILCILKRSWSVDQQSRDHVDGASDQAGLTLCRAGIPIEGWSGVGWQLHGCTTGRQHSIYPPEVDSTTGKSARYIWISKV